MYCNWDFNRPECCAPMMQDTCDTFCDCPPMDFSRCCYPCPPTCPVPCPPSPSCTTKIYPQQIVKEYMEKNKNGARKFPSIALGSKTEVVNKQMRDVRKPKLRSETRRRSRSPRECNVDTCKSRTKVVEMCTCQSDNGKKDEQKKKSNADVLVNKTKKSRLSENIVKEERTLRDKRSEVAKTSKAPSEPIPPKWRPFSEKFTRKINGGTKHQDAAKRKRFQETTADGEEPTICKCPQQPVINIIKCEKKCKSESNKKVVKNQPKKKVSQKYVPKSKPETIAQAEETDSDSDSAYKDIEEYHDSADSEGFVQNGDSEKLSPPQRERAKRDNEYPRAGACCCVCERFLKKRPEKPIEKPAEKPVESPEQKPRPKRSAPRPCTCCTCSQPVKVIMLVFRPTSKNKKLCKNTDAEVMDCTCIQNATVLRNLVTENCDSDSDSKLVELPNVSSDCFGEKLLCTCQFKDRKNFAKNGHMLNCNRNFQSRALGGAELSAKSYEENSCDDYVHLQRPISQRSSSLLNDLSNDLCLSKKDNDLESDRLLAECSMCSKISLSEDYICHPLHGEPKDYYLKDRSLEKLEFSEILKSYDSNSQSSNILKVWVALNNCEPVEVLWTNFKSPLSSHITITTRPSLITRYWSALKIDFYQKWDTVWKHMRAYKYDGRVPNIKERRSTTPMAIPSQSQSSRNSSKKTVPKKRPTKTSNTDRGSNSLSHEKALNPNKNTSSRFDNDRINMQEEYNKMIRNAHKNITEENCKPVLLCCTDNSRSSNQCACPKPEPYASPKSEPYVSPKPEPSRDSDKAPCTPCYCASSKSNLFSKKLFAKGKKVDTTPSDIICRKASATICSTGWRHFAEGSLFPRSTGPKKQKLIRTSCGCGNFLCGCKTILPGQQPQPRAKRDICDCPATIKVTKPERDICDCPPTIKITKPEQPQPQPQPPPPMAVIREEPEVSDKRSDKCCPPKQIEDYCADFLNIVHDNILESVRQSIDGGLRDYCMLTANKVDNLGTKLERNDEKLEMLYTDTRRNEEKLEKLYNDTMEKITEQSDNNLRQFRLLLEFISDIQNKKEGEPISASRIPEEKSATRINECRPEQSRIPEYRSAGRTSETDYSTVEDKEMQCCIMNDSKEDMKPKKMCCFAVDTQNDGRPRKCFCCKFVMNDDLNELMSSGSTEFDGSRQRTSLQENASTLGRKKSCLRNCGKVKCYCNDLDSPAVSQNSYGFNRRSKDQLDDDVYVDRDRETGKRESAGYSSSLIEITPTRRKYVCASVGTDNSDLTRYYCNKKKCEDQDTSGYVSDRDEQEYEKCSRKKIAKKTKSGQIVLTDSASVTCVCRQTDCKSSSALRTTISDTSVGEDCFAPQKHKTVVHKYSETSPRTRSK